MAAAWGNSTCVPPPPPPPLNNFTCALAQCGAAGPAAACRRTIRLRPIIIGSRCPCGAASASLTRRYKASQREGGPCGAADHPCKCTWIQTKLTSAGGGGAQEGPVPALSRRPRWRYRRARDLSLPGRGWPVWLGAKTRAVAWLGTAEGRGPMHVALTASPPPPAELSRPSSCLACPPICPARLDARLRPLASPLRPGARIVRYSDTRMCTLSVPSS